MTPAPTTREAELARRREYEARRDVSGCAWFCSLCKDCHANACPALWGGTPEVPCAVAHDAWMAERIRLMLTEGWF